MKQPPNKCPQSSAEEPNGGDRRVDFTFAFFGNSLPSSRASCPLTAAMFRAAQDFPEPQLSCLPAAFVEFHQNSETPS